MKTLTGHHGCVNDIAFSPDGRHLVSCGNDNTLRLWETHTGEGTILVEARGPFGRVAFTADGHHVLARPLGSGMRAWRVTRRRGVTTLIPCTSAIYPGGLAVAPKGGLVAANRWVPRPWRNVVRVWDTTTWKDSVLYETTENYSFAGLAFDPTGTRLATAVGVFDIGSGRRLVEQHIFSAALLWSPTAPLLAGAYGNMVVVRDADTGAHVTTLRLERKQIQDLAFSPDGASLAVVSNEEVVRVWDTRSWKEHSCLAWSIGKLKSIAFAPDGARAACAGHRGEILIWDWSG
jgi:WD40 repeat protein